MPSNCAYMRDAGVDTPRLILRPSANLPHGRILGFSLLPSEVGSQGACLYSVNINPSWDFRA